MYSEEVVVEVERWCSCGCYVVPPPPPLCVIYVNERIGEAR